jgi:hypothetical protein
MSKILDVKSIIKLSMKHGKEPFCARDEGLIALTGLAYFNTSELSLILVKDMMTERGGLMLDGYLPEEFSVNGFSRYFFIGKSTYLKKCLERYVGWRIENSLGCLDRNLYCGLDPESYFFLKNDGDPFERNHKRRHEGDTLMQPLQLQRHCKNFILGEGVSLNGLMDSFIVNFWEERSVDGTLQATRDLMEITGATAGTLKKKCVRKQRSIKEVMMDIYK